MSGEKIKPGYKRTEVGVIPEDWSIAPVGSLFFFKNGLNKAKEFFGYGTPIVNYMDVFGRAGLRIKHIDGLVDVTAREIAAYEVRKGDVFFTRTSETVEEIGIASVMLDQPEKTVFSGFILRARPSNESLDDVFKSYCFASSYFRQQVISRASYTTRALTNGRLLSAVLLVHPSLAEQRTIATVLSDIDTLLAKLDQLIAKKRDLKQATVQQLLTGQTRLPGFSGEWEVKTIEDLERTKLLRLSRGKVISKKDIERVPGDFPIYSSSVKGDGIFGTYGEYMFDEELITWSVDGGGHFFHRARHKFSVTNVSGFMRIDTSKISYRFLAAQLQYLHGSLNFDYTSKAHPSVIRKAYAVPLPTLSEQTAIAAVLSDIDIEIATFEFRRDKIRELKQGTMQELLTGRIRLI